MSGPVTLCTRFRYLTRKAMQIFIKWGIFKLIFHHRYLSLLGNSYFYNQYVTIHDASQQFKNTFEFCLQYFAPI